MIRVVLYQPEIPPNTGNIIRLCANVGAELHLIHPLGFELDDRRLRRAGLDYHEWSRVHEHPSLADFQERLRPRRTFAFSSRGPTRLSDARFANGDALLFGPETRGLPATVLESVPARRRVRIPMVADIRSLNLSNAVAIAVYEAWRQQGYPGGR